MEKYYDIPKEIRTLKTYDGKVYEFVDKYGENGDYIWNVAGISELSN